MFAITASSSRPAAITRMASFLVITGSKNSRRYSSTDPRARGGKTRSGRETSSSPSQNDGRINPVCGCIESYASETTLSISSSSSGPRMIVYGIPSAARISGTARLNGIWAGIASW